MTQRQDWTTSLAQFTKKNKQDATDPEYSYDV
jgi:hypothetical protein